MKSDETKLKNAALAERFSVAVQKLEQDKAVMEEIRNRNLWQQLFSNNTKDLARAGISQSEVISEMQTVFQDILGLIHDTRKNQTEIMDDLLEAIKKQTRINSDFRAKILSVAESLLKQSVQIDEL